MLTTFQVGDFEITIVSGGRLWIDGGNMFGVIPRSLWQRKMFPDEQNRILLETNCALVRTADSLGLIDTGYGSKAPSKIRERYRMEEGMPLVRNLAAANVHPQDIDWVVLTHLHFDHAGGCTVRDEHHQLQPTFPWARHFVHRFEWDDAVSQLPELAGSYFQDDFRPLGDLGLIEFIESDGQILPGVFTQLTGGHTRGHLTVTLASKTQSAVCTADICPTVAHLPVFWSMAYDQFPLAVRRVKAQVLQDIIEHDRTVIFAHDPAISAGRLRMIDGQLQVVSWPQSAE